MSVAYPLPDGGPDGRAPHQVSDADHMGGSIYVSRVTSRGRITVPEKIRERLGLRKGDRIEFVAEDRRTTVRRAVPKENPFDKFIGAFPAFKSRKEIHAWIREMRDPE